MWPGFPNVPDTVSLRDMDPLLDIIQAFPPTRIKQMIAEMKRMLASVDRRQRSLAADFFRMVASRGLLCRHLVSEGVIKPLI